MSVPRVVLLFTDDQRKDTVLDSNAGVVAMPSVKTEVVDRGITFQFAYNSTPLCGPSRSSLFTSLYAHNHGIHSNEECDNFDPLKSFVYQLKQAGVTTCLLGKYLNQYEGAEVPPGWSEWQVFSGEPEYYDYTLNENGILVPYGNDDADYSTDVLSNKALEFLADNHEEAFFLMVAVKNPHSTAVVAPRHRTAFPNLTPWRPPSFNEADVSDKPKYIRDIPLWSQADIDDLDTIRWRSLASNLAADDAVLAICNALRLYGIEDDTMFIFTSDNGMNWGEHRRIAKQAPYRECVNSPLYIRLPSVGTLPGVESRIVANIDIGQTILEYMLGSPMSDVNGVSLMPLLRGQNPPWRAEILIEGWQSDLQSITPTYSGIVTDTYKYVEYEDPQQGTELYHRFNDPWEERNGTNAPAAQAIKADLKARLANLLLE